MTRYRAERFWLLRDYSTCLVVADLSAWKLITDRSEKFPESVAVDSMMRGLTGVSIWMPVDYADERLFLLAHDDDDRRSYGYLELRKHHYCDDCRAEVTRADKLCDICESERVAERTMQ